MKYRVITFVGTIDGNQLEAGTIGTMGDLNPNVIKDTVTKQYRVNNPNAKNIAIVILNVEEVTSEQYNEAAKNFIELTAK